jgi:glyoxylase-like metal-dependent hydrolase (beta-lactamase superfamily II)
MPTDKDQETPRPPATAEFGTVEVGGASYDYPIEGSLRVRKLAVGPYENNVFAIVSGGDAVIIDGADEAERILALVDGLNVTAIVETHNHHDHVQALPALVEALEVPVYAHSDDPPPVPFTPLNEGSLLTVGDDTITAIHTPGHTPGSVCFSVGGFLFSGDTLFPAGPGKTADPKRFAQIMGSLDRLFNAFSDTTRVCPGHGLDTTIGRERPYVETWRARGW